jgi:hypothetical protein
MGQVAATRVAHDAPPAPAIFDNDDMSLIDSSFSRESEQEQNDA